MVGVWAGGLGELDPILGSIFVHGGRRNGRVCHLVSVLHPVRIGAGFSQVHKTTGVD